MAVVDPGGAGGCGPSGAGAPGVERIEVAGLALPELLAAGVSSFMVDTTLMNVEESAQAVGRVVRALKVAQRDGNSVAKMPDTTSGHLYRGVS